jgi:hypothetical protein
LPEAGITTTTTLPPQPPDDAPLEVREKFEEAVDLYSGDYDDYVPIGSTVTVAERRVIIAVTSAVVIATPAVPSGSGRGRSKATR